MDGPQLHVFDYRRSGSRSWATRFIASLLYRRLAYSRVTPISRAAAATERPLATGPGTGLPGLPPATPGRPDRAARRDSE